MHLVLDDSLVHLDFSLGITHSCKCSLLLTGEALRGFSSPHVGTIVSNTVPLSHAQHPPKRVLYQVSGYGGRPLALDQIFPCLGAKDFASI